MEDYHSMTGMSFSPVSSTVNTTVTGTLTFKTNDVRAVYIDWGDGESAKKGEANYQWEEINGSPNSLTVTHTYNKVDTFAPVLQFINTAGFVSNYMGPIKPFYYRALSKEYCYFYHSHS